MPQTVPMHYFIGITAILFFTIYPAEQKQRLHNAVTYCNARNVRILLFSGEVDPDMRYKKHGYTALHLAAGRTPPQGFIGDAINIIRLLVDAGGTVDAVSNTGKTPLWLAAHHGNNELAQALLLRRANPNRADFQGVPPLHRAARFGDPARSTALIETLTNAGAHINFLDDKGTSVFEKIANPKTGTISPSRKKALLAAAHKKYLPKIRKQKVSLLAIKDDKFGKGAPSDEEKAG